MIASIVVTLLALLYVAAKIIKYSDIVLSSLPPINPDRLVSAAERLNTAPREDDAADFEYARQHLAREHLRRLGKFDRLGLVTYDDAAKWIPVDVRREIEAGPCVTGRPHRWVSDPFSEEEVMSFDGRVVRTISTSGQVCHPCGEVRTV